MAEQRPTVGRIVHYVSHGSPVREDGTQAYRSECRAAIVTEVGPGLLLDAHLAVGEQDSDTEVVGLFVLNPKGVFLQRAAYGEALGSEDSGFTLLCDHERHAGGTWHWPART